MDFLLRFAMPTCKTVFHTVVCIHRNLLLHPHLPNIAANEVTIQKVIRKTSETVPEQSHCNRSHNSLQTDRQYSNSIFKSTKNHHKNIIEKIQDGRFAPKTVAWQFVIFSRIHTDDKFSRPAVRLSKCQYIIRTLQR